MKKTPTKMLVLQSAHSAIVELFERRLLLSTYTVNTLSDAVNPGPGLLTLRQAVADANALPGATTIAFDPKVFTDGSLHTITLTHGEIELSSGTTAIVGPGAGVLAISGDGQSRVFQVDYQSDVSLTGISVVDGASTTPSNGLNTYGGGIANAGQLTIDESTISGNSVAASAESYSSYGGATPGIGMGGGIYSTGNLTVTNSILSANTVSNTATPSQMDNYAESPAGGALGGAIYCTGSLVLANDTISENKTNGRQATYATTPSGGEAEGGGVYATGTVTISTSSISGNVAAGGHAQYSYNSGASGKASGGGLYSVGATAITTSTITDNSALAGNCGLDSGASGGAEGGGIWVGSALTVSSSTVSGNAATALGDYNGYPSAGGGIYAAGAVSIVQSSINDNAVTGSVPEFGNESLPTASGGGVYAGGAVTVVESSVSGNTTKCQIPFDWYGGNSIGGGIDAIGGGTISQSTILGNSALGGAGYSNRGYEFYGPRPGGDGSAGGIYSAGSMTITESTIADNTAGGGGGGSGDIRGGLGGAGQEAGSGSGGGVYSVADLAITNSTVTGNTATGGSGGYGQYGGGNGGNGAGGGIFSTAALGVMETTLSANATDAGGGGATAADNEPYFEPGKPGAATAGGVNMLGSIAIFTNSIFSGDKAGSTFDDISGIISLTSSNNLIGTGGGLTNGVYGNKIGINNPQLSPLGNYGGPTETMIPLPGSPAIGGGNASLLPAGVTTDQRGYPRTTNHVLDIGATQFGDATITGLVFNDEYATGKRQAGDPGLAGFTVYLDLNHDGQFDSGDISAVTNSSGVYSFADVPVGVYPVDIVAQRTWRVTAPAVLPVYVSVGSSQASVAGSTFAETQDALISGIVISSTTGQPVSGFRVYLDLNDDGKWESSEPSLVTSANGTWSFNIASPGTYEVRIVPMPQYKTIAPSGGLFTFDVGKASARIGNVFSEEPLA